jgi:hypothetical protein
MLDALKRRSFEVKTFYKVLLPNGVSPFPWKSIWRTKAPLKLAFFTWTASLGKILTLDNLRKCHIIVIDWCCMCKKSGKLLDHLFLHCDVARELWIMVFQMFGIEWVMPKRVVDLLACWNRGSAGMTTLLFGMQFLPSYSGAFGEKGTLEASMIKRERAWILWTCLLKTLFEWSFATTLPMSLAMQIFVLFFLFLICWVFSLVYFLCTWLRPLRF